MIYLLTAIGWPPGGSSTVHIYTQTYTFTHKHIYTQTCVIAKQCLCLIVNWFGDFWLCVIVKRRVYIMLSTGSVCLLVARDNEALVVYESEVK